jgi:hydroxymethylpyrimidine/phosphomethylpyrimidine kinase
MSSAVAVTIAGSDSGGGAGIQADLKTFAAMGVHGTSVITALTAQNTLGVTAIHEVPGVFVAAQIDAVFTDFDIGAVKIGMLGNAVVIEAVAAGLARYEQRKMVLDPVLAASSGQHLLAPAALAALRELLLPNAFLVTPNLPEAAALSGLPEAASETEILLQADRLLALGANAVLIKGGHATGAQSTDILVTPTASIRVIADRIATRNTHGTGCTLSAAIAAGLAKGEGLTEAVRRAKEYVTEAIAAADRLGVGHGDGPVHQLYRWW